MCTSSGDESSFSGLAAPFRVFFGFRFETTLSETVKGDHLTALRCRRKISRKNGWHRPCSFFGALWRQGCLGHGEARKATRFSPGHRAPASQRRAKRVKRGGREEKQKRPGGGFTQTRTELERSFCPLLTSLPASGRTARPRGSPLHYEKFLPERHEKDVGNHICCLRKSET